MDWGFIFFFISESYESDFLCAKVIGSFVASRIVLITDLEPFSSCNQKIQEKT